MKIWTWVQSLLILLESEEKKFNPNKDITKNHWSELWEALVLKRPKNTEYSTQLPLGRLFYTDQKMALEISDYDCDSHLLGLQNPPWLGQLSAWDML